MFDIAPTEILLTIIVAVVVIGPKDLPRALHTAGRWLGKMRRVSGHFRAGVETMIREAELADMEKKWREQNEAIMAAHPAGSEADGVSEAPASADAAYPALSSPETVTEPKVQAEPSAERREGAEPAQLRLLP